MSKAFPLVVWLASASIIGLPGPWAVAEQPIRIGSSLSITGKQYSAQGSYCREGYLLCQKHVNTQGGVLGRQIELVIYDDGSDDKTAGRNYEKLITEDKVDAVLGPYGSAITEAVADVTEKHRMLMIAPTAGTSSIWEKGRRYLIMMLSPVESLPEGLLDLAARNGLRRVAVIKLDGLVANAAANGASELAKKKGMEVVFAETYPSATSDFSDILRRVKAATPDVLMAASVRLDDLLKITRQMREVDLNVKMFSSVPYGLLPDFYKQLGKEAEFVYSGSFWDTGLPYPGNREFVQAYENEYNRTPSVQSAASYAGCRLLVETLQQTGSLDSNKLREALLALTTKTVLGDFAIDDRGFQIAHKAITIQWQDGKQVTVWPDEVVSAKPRFPTPPWSQR
ncbi:MAG TPA: amino acid ABC transporter substrate-binding protein [Hyphomicrobiaceae bacterium]|nr:amino acid ABC transporter substrate-binding protein [Hyphomicrobiaceae bacterium]